jgi:hypothetical protein
MQQYAIKALQDGAMVLGLVLAKGHTVIIDVEKDRATGFQALVDAGLVEIDGFKASPPADKAKK